MSQHKTCAVDISLHNHDRRNLLGKAREAGFTGFGLGRNFIHLDRRAKPHLWYYKGSRKLWQNS